MIDHLTKTVCEQVIGKRLKITLVTLLLLFSFPLFAFKTTPYFGTLAEFYLSPSYSYRYYPDVDRGENPTDYSSHDHLFDLNLSVRFLPNWEIQSELDFAATRKMNFGLRRTGLQLRYLLLDDVAGDLLSVALGLQLFYVPTRNLRDVSSPYHAQGNAQLGVSIGKEIDRLEDFLAQFYTFLGVGTGNRGFPFMSFLGASTFLWKERHQLQLFGEGYFGFGNRDRVDIARFNGYAKIRHQSIDLGLGYAYLFLVWGKLSAKYAYRVYARVFPEGAHTVTIAYTLPFSVL